MSNLPLTWADKKNSSLLADFIAKHGAEYCMTAEEINQMRDACNEMAVVQQSTFLGLAEPTSIPSGTGAAYWIAVKPGTYTNHGGFVLAANEMAFFARSAANTFSISKTSVTTIPGPAGPASTVPGPAGPAGPSGDGGALAIINELGISGPVNLLNGVTVTNGFYLDASGTPQALGIASYTDYIDVSTLDNVWFSNNLSGTFGRGGALYNSSKQFVASFDTIDSFTGFQKIALTLIGVHYIRINARNYATSSPILYTEKSYANRDKRFIASLTFTDAQLAEALGENPIVKTVYPATNLLTGVAVTNGFYLGTGAVPVALDIATYTDYINISAFSKIWFSNNLSGSFSRGGALYNASRELISEIAIVDQVKGFQSINTNGAYFARINVRDYPTTQAKVYSDLDYLNRDKIVIPNLYVAQSQQSTPVVVAPSYIYNVSMRNNETFIGASNKFIDSILALNSKSKFAFVSHHTIDGALGNGQLTKLVKSQQKMAEYWSSNLTELYKALGWVNRTSIPVNVLQANVGDGIHPAGNIENTKRIAGIIAHNMKGLFKDWTGKKVAWIGTSIPAGSGGTTSPLVDQYPLQIAGLLGCTVVNYSLSGAIMRTSKANGGALDLIGRYSFLTNKATYTALIGTANEPDLWVIDMGLNDFYEDPTDFNIDFS